MISSGALPKVAFRKPPDPRTGVARQVVRGLPDHPREREQCQAGNHEHRQLADRIEPIQDDHQRPEQQQRC
jgi:hypothetical protein